MATPYHLPSLGMFIWLFNQASGTEYTEADLSIGSPEPATRVGTEHNTRIKVSPTETAAFDRPYTCYYSRQPLDIIAGRTLRIESDVPELSVQTVLDEINRVYGFGITLVDVIDESFTLTAETTEVTLQASDASLVWTGSLSIPCTYVVEPEEPEEPEEPVDPPSGVFIDVFSGLPDTDWGYYDRGVNLVYAHVCNPEFIHTTPARLTGWLEIPYEGPYACGERIELNENDFAPLDLEFEYYGGSNNLVSEAMMIAAVPGYTPNYRHAIGRIEDERGTYHGLFLNPYYVEVPDEPEEPEEPLGPRMNMTFMVSPMVVNSAPTSPVVHIDTGSEDSFEIDLGQQNGSVTMTFGGDDGIRLSDVLNLTYRSENYHRVELSSPKNNIPDSILVLPDALRVRRINLEFEVSSPAPDVNYFNYNYRINNRVGDIFQGADGFMLTPEPRLLTISHEFPEGQPGLVDSLHFNFRRDGLQDQRESFFLDASQVHVTHPSHGSDFYAPAVDLAEIEPSNGIYTFNDGSTLEYLESGEFELTFGGPRGVYDEIPTLLLKEGISSLGEARFLFTMSEVASFRIGSPTNHDTYTTSALILPETDPTHYFGFGFRSFSTTDPEAAGKRIRFKIQGTRYTEDSSEKCHVRFLKREIELEGAELDEVKHYIRPHDFRDIEFNFDFDTILGGPPLSVGFLDDSTVGIAGITSDRRFFALATTYNYESSTSLDNFEPQRPLYNDLYRFFDLSIPEGVTPIIHDTAQLVKTFGSYVAWPTEEGAVILHMENNDNDWPETFDLKSYVHVRDADLEVLDRSDRACIDGAGALYWYLARVTEGVNIDRRVIVSVRFDPWTKAIQTTRALLPALVGQATRIGITGSVYLYLWNHEDPTRALHRVTARANSVTGLQNAGNWRTFTNPEFEGTEIRHLKYWSVTDTGQVFTPNPQSSTNNWTLRGYLPLEHNYSNADFSVYTDYLAGSFALSDVTYTSQTAVYHEGALKHALRVRHNDMFGNIITLTEDQKPTHFNPFGLGGNSRWIGWNDSFSHIRIM